MRHRESKRSRDKPEVTDENRENIVRIGGVTPESYKNIHFTPI
jgi:hypothetical protein